MSPLLFWKKAGSPSEEIVFSKEDASEDLELTLTPPPKPTRFHRDPE
jgi:hypothetical protein